VTGRSFVVLRGMRNDLVPRIVPAPDAQQTAFGNAGVATGWLAWWFG